MSQTFKNLKKQMTGGRISVKSVTAIVLFGAIILVFVLFGLPGRQGSLGAGGAAARVNNSLISLADLQQEAARMEQMYAPLFGGSIAAAQRQFIQQQALETLINSELISQKSSDEGILTTDAEVRDIIKEIPAFQKDGRFQKDLYLRVLEANRLTPGDFEEKLRKERRMQRTRRLFEAGTFANSIELEKARALKETKRNIAFVKIEKEKILATMPVSEADANKVLQDGAFAKKVEDYYNSNRAEFRSEEEIKAQHLLVKGTDEKALAKVTELRKRAETEDFGKLAKEFSEDTGSRSKGGDLGFFGPGKMVPEFEKVAFAQEIGVVSEPVKSPFGYHLIKVNEKKAAKEEPLDAVRVRIAKKLLATDKYDQMVTALEEALSKKESATFDALLKQMGLSWQETGFFELGVDTVPQIDSPSAATAAFEVSEQAPLLPRLVRDAGNKYAFKFKGEKKEPAGENKNLATQLARESTYQIFAQWGEVARKKATIERNLSVLKQ